MACIGQGTQHLFLIGLFTSQLAFSDFECEIAFSGTLKIQYFTHTSLLANLACSCCGAIGKAASYRASYTVTIKKLPNMISAFCRPNWAMSAEGAS